eukprot:CAMPEP_0117842440 /NCGR_PEP_ID=MMETSP0949-20121206/16039_1 /TAXON_ID=44440 /ORGANISM="Chattonella subsalsa, Strain CCMP2191" /LENGTH=66 /DNA_ID=CAMNT_0005686535 /DNA_START=170 /DNA_END=370 /DNA_ORIENTATION=-
MYGFFFGAFFFFLLPPVRCAPERLGSEEIADPPETEMPVPELLPPKVPRDKYSAPSCAGGSAAPTL